MIIKPPGMKYYGAITYDFAGTNCSSGGAAGIATGYANASSAGAAARQHCVSAGGRSCTNALSFGNAFAGANNCAALASGRTERFCSIDSGRADSQSAAQAAALAKCRARGHSCSSVVAVCSVAGPASAFSRRFQLGMGVDPPPPIRPPTPTNRPPTIAQGFEDGTVQQGGTLRYSVSRRFSDPDGDRLSISARSSQPNFATARVAGTELIITGVQGFTSGAVTITVTARDPGGLSVSQSFAVRVTGQSDLWGAIAIGPLFNNCRQRAVGLGL